MSQPATLPTWATTGGTRVAPTGPEQSAGFSAGFKPPAEYHNWLFGELCDWAAYLKVLDTDPHFLGAAYAWTNSHSFAVRPALSAPVARSTGLPVLESRVASGTDTGQSADGSPLFDTSGTQVRRLAFKVPSGATLTGVSVVLHNGSSVAGSMSLWKRSGGTSAQLGSTQTGTGGTLALSISSLTEVATDLSSYYIEATTADTSGTAYLQQASVQWNESSIIASCR